MRLRRRGGGRRGEAVRRRAGRAGRHFRRRRRRRAGRGGGGQRRSRPRARDDAGASRPRRRRRAPAACEAHLLATGATRARALDLPGNYLAPGVDERNTLTLGWLGRRGYVARAERATNLHLDVRTNPRVSRARAQAAAAAAAARGYQVRRATPDEVALPAAIADEFGGTWPFEVTRALTGSPAGVHVAVRDGAYAAFAAHDGNNAGLGWFGPAGTWPAHRGAGLGEAVLLACLVDVAVDHPICEVAWIGPRPFYERVAGVVGERRFVVLTKDLT
ncbi:MAG: hypothetical protein R2939_02225 [Kofleriaceae bacterium]